MSRPESLVQTLPRLDRIVKRFAPQLRQQWQLVTGSIVALIAGTLLKLLEPWPLKILFDCVLHQSSKKASKWSFLPWLDDVNPGTIIWISALALAVITILRAGCEYLNTLGFAIIGNRVLRRIRDEVFRHLQTLSLRYYSRARTGDLTIRVIGDINLVRDVAVTAVLPLVASSLILIGMWTVMFFMHWRLSLLGLSMIPLLLLRTRSLSSKIKAAAKKQRQREGEMASTASEVINSIKAVQTLSLESRFADEFTRRNDSAQKEEVRNAKLSAKLERSVDVLLAITTGAVMLYGSELVLKQQLSAGSMLVFLAYLKRAFNPVQDFAKYTSRLSKAAAAGERVLQLLDTKPEIADLPDAKPAPQLRGDVQFEHVHFRYEGDREVLRNITLSVPSGTHVALVGPSGGGKTTLINLLPRLYDPSSGRILIDGVDIRAFTLQTLRSQVGVVLQETALFAASVRENIAFARTDASDEDVQQAARLANAHEFIMELPYGYETVLGERGVTLSGGQRQRLAIARAALGNQPVLIFDELTNGLDEHNAATVSAAIRALSRGRTTFNVTHDLAQASEADLIVFVAGGRIVEQGSHEQLMMNDGLYARMYRQQLAIAENIDALPG